MTKSDSRLQTLDLTFVVKRPLNKSLYLQKIEALMHKREEYPIGIQSFSKIRKEGYIYVDKTEYIHKLVTSYQYYFLGRPRRFGKSLLLSTIEEYFLGHKELFEGLAISRYEHDWTEYPVLHLDLNSQKYGELDSLDNMLSSALDAWEEKYGVTDKLPSLSLRFGKVIKAACEKTGRKVVVLIDEYDKPLLNNIFNEEFQREFRSTLKAFYGVLKSMDRYIRFALLTGVTKFGKVSVFSDLNNLNDISFWDRYNGVCGITEAELHHYFTDDVSEMAETLGITSDEAFTKMKENYDGYHFSDCLAEEIYNPFSVLNTLAKKRFYSYWFETGTPTFLVELLRNNNYNLASLNGRVTDEMSLQGVDMVLTDPIGLIYQSGYLTIKSFDREFETYTLGYPNREVEEGFVKFMMPFYANVRQSDTAFAIQSFVKDVREGRIDEFMERLKSLYSDFPYEKVQKLELHYQNVMYIVMTLMGFHVHTEYHTSRGRIDLVIDTPSRVYVMEFKLDGTAEEALRQIDERGYAEPFASTGKTVVKVGVNFSSETRSIDRWIVEE